MKTEAIISKIDHTRLNAFCTEADIAALCSEAAEYGTASVCIPPCWVAFAHEKYGDKIKVCTVIGFPLGYNSTAVKVSEAADAVKCGADEIDMVINLSYVKSGMWDAVKDEIAAIRQACAGKILKVIIETCYLTEEEKIRLCEIVTECRADFIKTSTGFGTDGAVLSDIALFKAHIGTDVKIKAAGGIRSREAAESFIEAGCSRIGTSALKKLME